MRKQIHRGGLGTALFVERRLRAAFLAMPRHLRVRPEPRSRFDEVARRDNPTSPWRAIVCGAQACLAAAALEGPSVHEATRADVGRFADELRAAMLMGHEASTPALDGAIVTAAREAAEAQSAKTRYAVERSPAALDVAIKEVTDMVDAGVQFVAAARHERDALATRRVHA